MTNHERYAEATNEAKRAFMAQQLFPMRSRQECREIAEIASLIYWWEIEPAQKAAKTEQAIEMFKKGATLSYIAATLKLSEQRVREALAGISRTRDLFTQD
jgi:DNA-binding NarL/FixJ family response regulator